MTSAPQGNLSSKEDRKEYAAGVTKEVADLHADLLGGTRNSGNIMLLAGYAAIFATWSLTKGSLGPVPSALTALLLMVSIASFMTFEVYRILKPVGTQVRYINNVNSLNTPDNVISAFDRLKRDGMTAQQDMLKIWYLSFSVSAVTGISAMLLLFYKYADIVTSNI